MAENKELPCIPGVLRFIYVRYCHHHLYFLPGLYPIDGRLTGQDNNDLFKLFSPDNIWKTVCFATSFLLYLPGMIIINLFINEVNFKTHRQNIIDGWIRETFIYTQI